jgi:DNA-binding HxlR family transcriptional regulator
MAEPEYCPVSMGAAIVAERWNLLIIREILTGATRFNDIHRGLPGLSRTLLSQRLRVLQHNGLVEPVARGRPEPGGYRLTPAGEDLRGVLTALGTWAVRWQFPEPRDNQLNPHLLLWRMRSGLARDRLPAQRVVIEFSFEDRQTEHGWLILDGDDSSICARSPMFEVDVYAAASSRRWHEIWFGHRSLRESISNGDVVLTGRNELTRQFADWFSRSPFADQVAAHRSATPATEQVHR